MAELHATDHRAIGLDALRGAAALLVVLSHVDVAVGEAHLRTDTGVMPFLGHLFGSGVWMFFALSGYLVGRPWLTALVRGEPLPEVRSYAWRRAGRIFPAYWPALAAAVVVVGARAQPWQIVTHAALVHSLVPGESQAVYFVAWTLGLEAVFYVTLPVVAAAIRRFHAGPIDVGRLARWLLAASFVGLAAAPLVDAAAFEAGARSPLLTLQHVAPSLVMFVPGMLIALATLDEAGARGSAWRWWRRASTRPLPLAAAATVLMVASRAIWSVEDPVLALRAMPVAAVASGLALGAVVAAAPTGRPTRVLAAAGTVSYGVYLWHWVLVVLLREHALLTGTGSGLGGWAVRSLLLVPASVALGWLSWTAIERPAMAWARQRAARRTDVPSLAGGTS